MIKKFTGEKIIKLPCTARSKVIGNYSGLRLVMRLISMINALPQNFIAGEFLTKIRLLC
jgi:hypothetical protein